MIAITRLSSAVATSALGDGQRRSIRKSLVAFSTALMFLTAIPASAMCCCGSGKAGKGAAMCGRGELGKGSMAMNHGGQKGHKMSCCCEGMAGKMSKRG